MSELLAPVGNKEAFYAAIANGCDAIYLGLNKHNARAYADNFTLDNLKDYVDFAHLRNVKVYVTLNTIVYDNELNEVYQMIDELAKMNVDAIIVQDLAVLLYATNKYESLVVHASTQMGIDDVEGAKLLKKLGVKRIVLARETSIDTIKEIKEQANIEVETFIHGALCVSYSGNCFMSASIGERSGNRGRCAGCCRKLYTLVDLDNKTNIKTGYLLSMKDLNLSSYIKDMDFIDSFKIEGRMKEPSYVAMVTNTYRKIIDKENVDIKDLEKVFNRTYTKGFIFNEKSEDITNIKRPNNYGYLIGKVNNVKNNRIQIKLFSSVNKGDQIRIENNDGLDDINITLTKMFDLNKNIIETADKNVVIFNDKKVKINDLVYKIKDLNFLSSLNVGTRVKEYKKIGINGSIKIIDNEPILLKISYKNHIIYQKSDYIVQKSISNPTTKSDIINHLNKLNDTPYFIDDLDIVMDDNIFVPIKVINELRRNAINKLNIARLNNKIKVNKNPFEISVKQYENITPIFTIEVSNLEQYNLAKNMGFEHIYFNNIIARNNIKNNCEADEILVGGLSSINFYKDKNKILVSDKSLNVNNHVSVGLLSALGVDRITLSSEMNKDQIQTLIQEYKNEYHTHPNLEMIIYGRAKIMHSKYCPLKRLGKCGECKNKHFALKDDYETFPLKFNDDCTINLLNSKILNLIDDLDYIKGINYFRLAFSDETIEEMESILNIVLNKMNNNSIKCFDGKKHTRGTFKKTLL